MSADTGPTLPLLRGLKKALETTGSKAGVSVPDKPLIAAFLVLLLLFTANAPLQSDYNWSIFFLSAPLWLPILAGRMALLRWLQYRRMKGIGAKTYVLLEIRIPRDTLKTPQAMETFFANLHIGSGESTWHKKYWVGGTRPWWSFELVSIEGVVHFYIWTREDFRKAIETYLYAQYPEIEIIEVADYARLVDPSQKPYKMNAFEFKHTEPDPYPLKTYVDYGLDKPPGKDEEPVDPLAQVLELLGSVGQGEQVWVQICIRVTKSEKFRTKKNKKGKPYTWKDEAREKIEELRKQQVIETGESQKAPLPTEGQKNVITAIERNTGKPGYDVGIRAVYFAPEEKFYGSMGGYIRNIFKPFSSSGLNGLATAPVLTDTFLDYPWVDPTGKMHAKLMRLAINLYRRRAFFNPPYRGNWMIMSAEELATLYHIPTRAVKTSSIPRIQSATTAAPANLPT